MKKLILMIGFLSLCSPVFAVPSNSMSITPTATSGTTIAASDENSRNSTISTTYNAHDHTDLSQTGNTLAVGDGAAGNKTVQANNADSNKPFIRYDDTNDVWIISRDGSTTQTIVVMTGTAVNNSIFPQTPTDNDLLVHSGGAWNILVEGTAGRALTFSGTDLSYQGMITEGDLDFHTGTGRGRLPVGAAGTVLTSVSGRPAWRDVGIKAWFNLDGTGTIAIRDSFNVDAGSIVDNAEGDYTIPWTTDFASASYAVVCEVERDAGQPSGDGYESQIASGGLLAGSVQILVKSASDGAASDAENLTCIAIGDQ